MQLGRRTSTSKVSHTNLNNNVSMRRTEERSLHIKGAMSSNEMNLTYTNNNKTTTNSKEKVIVFSKKELGHERKKSYGELRTSVSPNNKKITFKVSNSKSKERVNNVSGKITPTRASTGKKLDQSLGKLERLEHTKTESGNNNLKNSKDYMTYFDKLFTEQSLNLNGKVDNNTSILNTSQNSCNNLLQTMNNQNHNNQINQQDQNKTPSSSSNKLNLKLIDKKLIKQNLNSNAIINIKLKDKSVTGSGNIEVDNQNDKQLNKINLVVKEKNTKEGTSKINLLEISPNNQSSSLNRTEHKKIEVKNQQKSSNSVLKGSLSPDQDMIDSNSTTCNKKKSTPGSQASHTSSSYKNNQESITSHVVTNNLPSSNLSSEGKRSTLSSHYNFNPMTDNLGLELYLDRNNNNSSKQSQMSQSKESLAEIPESSRIKIELIKNALEDLNRKNNDYINKELGNILNNVRPCHCESKDTNRSALERLESENEFLKVKLEKMSEENKSINDNFSKIMEDVSSLKSKFAQLQQEQINDSIKHEHKNGELNDGLITGLDEQINENEPQMHQPQITYKKSHATHQKKGSFSIKKGIQNQAENPRKQQNFVDYETQQQPYHRHLNKNPVNSLITNENCSNTQKLNTEFNDYNTEDALYDTTGYNYTLSEDYDSIPVPIYHSGKHTVMTRSTHNQIKKKELPVFKVVKPTMKTSNNSRNNSRSTTPLNKEIQEDFN